MAETFYVVSKSILITNPKELDSRYIVETIGDRNDLANGGTAFKGLQTYVTNAVADPDITSGGALYILIDDAPLNGVWERIESGSTVGASAFVDLTDTPSDYTSAVTGDIITVEIDGADPTKNKLTFSTANTAHNKDYGVTSEMATITHSDAKTNSAGLGIIDKLIAIDHHHDGRYYDKTDVDTLIEGAKAGIKDFWDTQADIEPTVQAIGERGLLKDNSGTTTDPLCAAGTWSNMTVYEWTDNSPSPDCWTELYTMGSDTFADLVRMSSTSTVINVTTNVGGYSDGDTVQPGEDVFAVLEKILTQTKLPTATAASINTTTGSSPSATVEIGTPITASIDYTDTTIGVISGWTSAAGLPANPIIPTTTPRVGSTTSIALGVSTGGFTNGGSTAGLNASYTGFAQGGNNTAKATYDTTVETAPVYDSKGQLYTGITRSTSSTPSKNIVGQSFMAWGDSASTSATPKTRAAMMGISATYRILWNHTTQITPRTFPGTGKVIWILLQGTYLKEHIYKDAGEVRFMLSNNNILNDDSVEVININMEDASGNSSNTIPYTLIQLPMAIGIGVGGVVIVEINTLR